MAHRQWSQEQYALTTRILFVDAFVAADDKFAVCNMLSDLPAQADTANSSTSSATLVSASNPTPVLLTI